MDDDPGSHQPHRDQPSDGITAVHRYDRGIFGAFTGAICPSRRVARAGLTPRRLCRSTWTAIRDSRRGPNASRDRSGCGRYVDRVGDDSSPRRWTGGGWFLLPNQFRSRYLADATNPPGSTGDWSSGGRVVWSVAYLNISDAVVGRNVAGVAPDYALAFWSATALRRSGWRLHIPPGAPAAMC